MSKYGEVIKKARKQEKQTLEPESQQSGLPGGKEEEVNLSIKVPKRLRRHWVSEAKRLDTTVTAAIIAALKDKFGEPDIG